MYQGKAQKYGTQFVPDGKRHRLWDVDPTTTDDERAAKHVPSLQEKSSEPNAILNKILSLQRS